MKIRQILPGQAARPLVEKNYGASHRTIHKLINELKQRYYFLQSPNTIDELRLENGIIFLKGVFEEDLRIDRLQLFSGAMLCEASIDLDDCERFLDDVTQLSSDILGVPVEENLEYGRLYVSQIEVEFEVSLRDFMHLFNEIGMKISEHLSGYGNTVEPYTPATFSMIGGTVKGSNINVEPFKIEERVGVPRHENVYYSGAPLRTKDHIETLELVEDLFANKQI